MPTVPILWRFLVVYDLCPPPNSQEMADRGATLVVVVVVVAVVVVVVMATYWMMVLLESHARWMEQLAWPAMARLGRLKRAMA